MKSQYAASLLIVTLIGMLSISASAAERKPSQGPALSNEDVNHISDRMKQTSDQMREDIKKARARFEVQEVERKQEAERAHQQAIKDNAMRQAQKAAQAREHQLAMQAAAERARVEAEQAKLQAERKKQMVVAAQESKETQTATLLARKLKAAEALKKLRASSGPKAFE